MDDPNIYSVHSVVFIFWTSTSVFFFYRKPILFFNKNTTDNDGILFVVFFFFGFFVGGCVRLLGQEEMAGNGYEKINVVKSTVLYDFMFSILSTKHNRCALPRGGRVSSSLSVLYWQVSVYMAFRCSFAILLPLVEERGGEGNEKNKYLEDY